MKLIYCLVYLGALGILSQIVGMCLPRRLFTGEGFLFRCRPWEKGGKVYEKLGIKKWKTKLPDMSKIIKQMRPKSIKTAFTGEIARAMLQETCVAELIHLLLALFGFPCIFIWRGWGVLAWVLYALGNVPFILIQRYNRPRYASLIKAFDSKNADK